MEKNHVIPVCAVSEKLPRNLRFIGVRPVSLLSVLCFTYQLVRERNDEHIQLFPYIRSPMHNTL